MYLGSLPSVSNREDWRQAMQLVDADTGEIIDIQLCTIMLTLRDFKTKQPMFKGSTDSGEISIAADNSFQWLFPAQTMGGLCQAQYELGLRISQEDRVAQLAIATIEVYEGIDQQ
jgi:hypothetical protein